MKRTEHAAALPWAFAVAGAISLLAAGALACNVAEAAVESVNVDGTCVYSSKAKAKTKSVSGVSYDAKTATLTLKNLKLTPTNKASKSDGAIYIAAGSSDTVTVALKGTNSIAAGKAGCYGIRTAGKLKLTGTNLTTTGMGTAIKAHAVTIGTGTYSFKKCSKAGILATSSIAINGSTDGSVSVTTTTPEQDTAIAATSGSVSNHYKRLGTIKGKLGTGCTYNHSGSTYQVTAPDTVKLVSYGGTTQANTRTDTYGKNTYNVQEICARAFSTQQGAKVTKIVLGPNLRVIGKEAFKGTEHLTNLNISSWLSGLVGSLEISPDAISKRFGTADIKIDSKAFAGMGELAGFNLAVHSGIKQKQVNLAIKAALTLRGLPLLAQVTK